MYKKYMYVFLNVSARYKNIKFAVIENCLNILSGLCITNFIIGIESIIMVFEVSLHLFDGCT